MRACRSSTPSRAGSHGTNIGQIRVRRKWSGQLVPIAHSSAAHADAANVSASGELSQCAITRLVDDTAPRRHGSNRAAIDSRSATAIIAAVAE